MPKFHYKNVFVEFDSISEKIPNNENVFGVLYEEQVVTWEFFNQKILESKNSLKAQWDLLDVGSGSGFFSILFAKYFGGKILAIDKSRRATLFTQNNALKNGVQIEVRHEDYSFSTVKPESVKIIYFNPPFNIYPVEIENHIPVFSRGGTLGQDEFKKGLKIAKEHLVKNGVIVFIMMCLGNDNKPEYIRYINKIMGKVSIFYKNIFPPIETKVFLRGVYGNKFFEFQKNLNKKYKQIFYTNGIIRNDGKETISEISEKINLKGKSWDDRIVLHRNINFGTKYSELS